MPSSVMRAVAWKVVHIEAWPIIANITQDRPQIKLDSCKLKTIWQKANNCWLQPIMFKRCSVNILILAQNFVRGVVVHLSFEGTHSQQGPLEHTANKGPATFLSYFQLFAWTSILTVREMTTGALDVTDVTLHQHCLVPIHSFVESNEVFREFRRRGSTKICEICSQNWLSTFYMKRMKFRYNFDKSKKRDLCRF